MSAELTHLSLFSGIGGLDLAAEWAGMRTVGQCEIADYPHAILMKIIVNKHEYAELIRACAKNRNIHAMCSACLLAELCEGHEFMESMCEILEDEE